jgi:hypothetical protein
MKKNVYLARLFAALVVTTVVWGQPVLAPSGRSVRRIQIVEGQILYEMVGQVVNGTPSTSTQFGYYTYVKDVDALFAAGPQNETTAAFTFYRETTNVRITNNGPLRIISREGNTTVYVNPAPSSDFGNPASFRTGVPVQTSVLRQQVIVNTVTQSFSVVNEDSITSTSLFVLNGREYELGRVGDRFVTTKTGHMNAVGGGPSGWFSGFSIGAQK